MNSFCTHFGLLTLGNLLEEAKSVHACIVFPNVFHIGDWQKNSLSHMLYASYYLVSYVFIWFPEITSKFPDTRITSSLTLHYFVLHSFHFYSVLSLDYENMVNSFEEM